MKANKVIEAYRLNIGVFGFYILMKMYFFNMLFLLYVAYENDIISLETLKDSFVILGFDLYMAIGFVSILLLELLLSMFQWYKKRRKEVKK